MKDHRVNHIPIVVDVEVEPQLYKIELLAAELQHCSQRRWAGLPGRMVFPDLTDGRGMLIPSLRNTSPLWHSGRSHDQRMFSLSAWCQFPRQVGMHGLHALRHLAGETIEFSSV